MKTKEAVKVPSQHVMAPVRAISAAFLSLNALFLINLGFDRAGPHASRSRSFIRRVDTHISTLVVSCSAASATALVSIQSPPPLASAVSGAVASPLLAPVLSKFVYGQGPVGIEIQFALVIGTVTLQRRLCRGKALGLSLFGVAVPTPSLTSWQV